MGDDTPEREMKDFQFRQMKKIRVFDSPEDLPRERSSLLAVSNKFGLTFAAQGRELKVFSTEDLVAAGKISGNTNEIVEGVKCQTVTLDLPMHHLALSSDELTLSVCGASEDTTLTLDFYDVRTFFNKTRQEKRPFASFKAGSESDTLVQDLKWSPVEAFRVAACLSDGSMMVLDVTEKDVAVTQLPASVGITCICWSPKGKQIAAGKQNATVVQYTPALQEKKVIPCPSFYTADNPVKVLDLLWLSTYNFAVVYAAADGSPETPPELVMVSLPKKDEKKEDKFLNFSDIVYGSCTERQHHYFLNHIEEWDLILAASAASIEVSIIAKQEDKTNWELWLLEDASRGELPVTLNNDDTLPVGVGIDYTSQGEIHISDEKKLPPAPTLLILSTDGVLCPFSLINLNLGVKQLVMPAGSLPQDGERPPLQKSVPPPQAPAASKPPAPAFPSFSMPSVTPAITSAPPASTAAPAAPNSSSLGLPFSLPSTSSSLFSFGGTSSTSSIFPSASSFSFTAPKPAGEAPSLPSFSFGAVGIKPLTEVASAPGHVATASPVTLPKGPAEPATPNVRVNLNDRFLAADTPAPPAPSTQPFSFTSTPKPAAAQDSGAQPKPMFTITKPAVPPTVTRPAAAPNSAPSATVQKTAPAPTAPSVAPSTQLPSVKSVEKQLQQAKDLDPVMVGIQEEIAHFKKEMDELKARVKGADFSVGSTDEMRELRKESEDLHRFTLEIKETTESMHGDISTLKTTLLEGFAGAEEARAQRELNRDKGYLQLLYKKPLDPRSENQLKEIRRLYQYVKFAVEDVNDVLDMEWEKHLEKKRKQKHMIVPEREALYTALANNMDIINQQKQKLEHLLRDLQSLRLYNKPSSQLTSTSSPSLSSSSSQGLDSELESLKNALLKASLDMGPSKAPTKSPSKMTPVKQTQLRNFLSKRQTPPVRSTAPANLSRSAFLSPKYFEDLDDASSTSSLYQPQECDDALPEEVEVPQPIPTPPRHPTVVRTSSIQPRAIADSAPSFSSVLQWPGIDISTHTAPKINMDGADSTVLATKTVTHKPPPTEKATPTEKTTPTILPPTQAARIAALNRQMNSYKPMTNLTELTLKNVPQVVNVQELKDNRSTIPVSTDPGVFQQVLVTVEAKKNSTQDAVKVHPPVSETALAQPSFMLSRPTKPDSVAPFSLASPLQQQSSKAVSPTGFTLTQSTTSSQSPPANTSQISHLDKGVTPVVKIPQKPATSDTLVPFVSLKVSTEDEVKDLTKPSAAFTLQPPGSMTFTFANFPKPVPAGNDSDPTDVSKNPQIFKPSESGPLLTSKTFTFTPGSPASLPSLSSLVTAPLAQETPSVPEKPPEPEPSPPPESISATTQEEPTSEPSPEPSAVSTSTPSPASVTEEPPLSQPKQEEAENPSSQATSLPESTPTSTATSMPPPAETVPVTVSNPIQETTPATTASSAPVEQQAPPASSAEPAAPPSTTPGSIFTQPAVSTNSTTLSFTSFTPVISTAAISTCAPAPAPVFAQPVSTSSTPAFGSSGFGAPSTTSSFGKPVFGQPASVGFGSGGGFTFGQSGFGGGSGFGQTAAASTAPAPASSSGGVSGGGVGGGLFGSVSSTNASSFSFGSSSTSSGANPGTNIFGQSGAPAFGQSGGTSGFGQGSIFGSNTATTTTSSGFSFGQPTAVFGSTSSSSVFGQQPSTNSVFGQPSSSGGLFGSGAANSSSSSGGGFFSGLGGKPSEDAANKNPFGASNNGAFGQTTQTGNLFGNSGAKTFGFGVSTFGEQKSSGTFSAGGGSVAAQGFGSFSTPAKTVAGFGSAPVFGSPPAFGGSPAFGGQATFGSAPAFNSPLGSSAGKVFGEGTSAASVGGFGFASPPPSGHTFGNLATQNSAPTFGSLAQQSPGFGGQSSGFSGFGSSGGFGGFGNTNTNQSSSQTFASWRS